MSDDNKDKLDLLLSVAITAMCCCGAFIMGVVSVSLCILILRACFHG